MKYKRQGKILSIIRDNNIQTHEQLVEELGKAGIKTTQTTVSRDIKELRLVKVPLSGGGSAYAAPNNIQRDEEQRTKMITDTVISVDYSFNCIVIKTYPGMASAVASGIEAMNIGEFAGTMAVDNTIFMMCKDISKVAETANKLRELGA